MKKRDTWGKKYIQNFGWEVPKGSTSKNHKRINTQHTDGQSAQHG
jgi:hypothetical protein